MSGSFSNGENLVAIRQAGVIRNCVFDFNEVIRRKANKDAFIPDGVNTAATFNIHRGAPVFRRKRLANAPFVRVGGSVADKDLLPTQAAFNGAGSKSTGLKTLYDEYEFVGFSLSNDVRMAEDNVQNSDSLAVQAHGVITVPHQGNKSIKMGDKVMWSVVDSSKKAQDQHRQLIGRPQVSVFAHLEPYKPKSLKELVKEYLPSTEKDKKNYTNEEKIAVQLKRLLETAAPQMSFENVDTVKRYENSLRRSEAKRVIGIAQNNAAQGDFLDLFIYPQHVFDDGRI